MFLVQLQLYFPQWQSLQQRPFIQYSTVDLLAVLNDIIGFI
jgi:hypothetical protein